MAKEGKGKKLRRAGKDKAYYASYRARYSGKLIRRRGDREKRQAFFAEHPDMGSPSQLLRRSYYLRIKTRKKKKQHANID